MALVKMQAPIEKISGQVGGANGPVLYFTRGRQFSRSFFNPFNPKTSFQTLIRGFLAAAATAWSAVTEAQADGWNALIDGGATDNDVFGDAKRLDPMNLYTRVNMLRQIDGQAIIAAAPSPDGNNGPILITSATWNNITGQLQLFYDAIGGSGNRQLFIRTSLALPGLQRKARFNEMRFRTATLSGSVQTATAGSTTDSSLALDPTLFPSSGSFRIGLTILSTGDAYIPGARLVQRSITVTQV